MGTTLRTFIALELPDSVLAAASKVQAGLQACGFKLRWVPVANMHLTLVFLGDIVRLNLERVFQAVDQTAQASTPFDLKAAGVGVFPHWKRPRVLWIGMGGETDVLAGLKRTLDIRLEADKVLDYRPEKRPFSGHLTLGRIKGRIDSRRLADAIQPYAGLRSADFRVRAVTVFQSRLTPGGAVYTRLHTSGFLNSDSAAAMT